jgi:hypothetical protein
VDARSARLAWIARFQILRKLGVRGLCEVAGTAIELAQLKRSLLRKGLRASIGDRDYREMFGEHMITVSAESDVDEVVKHQLRIVRLAAKKVGATCLPRSIVLARQLRQRGLHPMIRIGVADLPTVGMAAHAWVELAGKPVGEDASTFAPFGVDDFDRAFRSLGVER